MLFLSAVVFDAGVADTDCGIAVANITPISTFGVTAVDINDFEAACNGEEENIAFFACFFFLLIVTFITIYSRLATKRMCSPPQRSTTCQMVRVCVCV